MKKLIVLLLVVACAIAEPMVQRGVNQKIEYVSASGNGSDSMPYVKNTIPVDLVLAVKMGMMPGYSAIDKFGVNRVITVASAPEDLWEYGGQYTYDTDSTAPIAYISSDSTSDTSQSIEITGLDISGYNVVQTAITNGQTNVALATPLWRVFRMRNTGNKGSSLAGVLYCHSDATTTLGVPDSANVRAIVDDGKNQTLMALYTVPRGKVGFLYRGEVGIDLEGNAAALAEYAHLHYETQRYGKIFTTKKSMSAMVGGSIYQDVRSFPDVLPGLTDLKISVVEVTATMGIFGTFDILLVDDTLFTSEYLHAIKQPGY